MRVVIQQLILFSWYSSGHYCSHTLFFLKKKGMNNNIHTCDSCEGSSFTAEELVIVELKVEKTHRLLFLCEECYGKQNSPDEDI